MLRIIPLLSSTSTDLQQQIEQIITTQSTINQFANIQTTIDLLEIANALDIKNLYTICINLLKNYVADPVFLQALVGNNTLLQTLNISKLPAELIDALIQAISSDQEIVNRIARTLPDSYWLKRVLRGHDDSVISIAFSHDNRILASGSQNGSIRLWNVNDGSIIRSPIGHTERVNSVAFSSDNRILASGSDDGLIVLWNVSDGSSKRVLRNPTTFVISIAFSPNGLMLASASEDGSIRLWNVNDGSIIRTLIGHRGWVNNVTFSADGRILASADSKGTVILWNVSDGSIIRVLSGHTNLVHSISFSPDGLMLASTSEDGTIRLWNVTNGSTMRVLTGPTGIDINIAFSPEGHILASASYDEDKEIIRLWNINDGSIMRVLTGHSGVNTVAFSSDGLILVSGSFDTTIRLWNTLGRLLQQLRSLSLDQLLLLLARSDHNTGFTTEQKESIDAALEQLNPPKSRMDQLLRWGSSVLGRRSFMR